MSLKQPTYTAFSGFLHGFTYHIRTIPDFQHQLQQIDNIIDTELLPNSRPAEIFRYKIV
jgi:hypothetical protein